MEKENKEIENLEPVEQQVSSNVTPETTPIGETSAVTTPVQQEQNNQTMPTENKDNISSGDLSNEFVEKKKNNKKILVAVLSIVLVLLVAFGYKLYLGDSIVLFKTALNRGYKDISEILDSAEKNQFEYDLNENIVIDGNVNLNSNLEELATYTGYDYKFNMGVNVKEQKMGLGLSLLKNNETVIDGIFYILQNMLYMKSDKVYSQVLYSDMGSNMFESMNTEEIETTYNYDDIDRIVEKMTIYVGNAFERENFTKENSTLNVNNEEMDVVKHIYTIDKDAAYNIMTSILNQIKEDEEFVELVAKVADIEVSEVKEALNEATVSKEDFEYFETIKLNIYTTGFFPKFLGMGMTQDGITMTYTETKEQSEFNLSEESISVKAVTKDNVTEGSVKSSGSDVLTFKLKLEEKDKSSKMDLNLSIPLLTANVTANIESNRVSNKRMENTIQFNFNMGSGEAATNLDANLVYNMEIGGTMPTVATEGAVDVNTLPETELVQLMTNIQNAVVGTPLEALFAEDDSYTDEGYGYEYSDDYNSEYDDYTSMYRLEDLVDLLTPNTVQ